MQIARAQYASFWKRFAAALIDGIVFYIASLIVMAPFGALAPGLAVGNARELTTAGIGIALFITAIKIVMGWLYYALMESSDAGATLGKMVMGIKVTDLNGKKVSFGKATGRHFGKFISCITLYIGFIMAGFTAKKQGLHDIMAGCLVMNK
jgi:uncharacterized RDD family membrane protein YckC